MQTPRLRRQPSQLQRCLSHMLAGLVAAQWQRVIWLRCRHRWCLRRQGRARLRRRLFLPRCRRHRCSRNRPPRNGRRTFPKGSQRRQQSQVWLHCQRPWCSRRRLRCPGRWICPSKTMRRRQRVVGRRCPHRQCSRRRPRRYGRWTCPWGRRRRGGQRRQLGGRAPAWMAGGAPWAGRAVHSQCQPRDRALRQARGRSCSAGRLLPPRARPLKALVPWACALSRAEILILAGCNSPLYAQLVRLRGKRRRPSFPGRPGSMKRGPLAASQWPAFWLQAKCQHWQFWAGAGASGARLLGVARVTCGTAKSAGPGFRKRGQLAAGWWCASRRLAERWIQLFPVEVGHTAQGRPCWRVGG